MVKVPQAQNATTKRYHQTQALMGSDASRVGIEKGGKYEPLLNNSCIFSRRETRLLKNAPITRDASLPIGACVLCLRIVVAGLQQHFTFVSNQIEIYASVLQSCLSVRI